jgi:hypothetical protein
LWKSVAEWSRVKRESEEREREMMMRVLDELIVESGQERGEKRKVRIECGLCKKAVATGEWWK